MTDLATFVMSALLTIGLGVFLLLLVAGAMQHRAWSRDRGKRGAGYLR